MLNLAAKSKPFETIREHTDKLLSDFEEILKLYPGAFDEGIADIIRLVCEYHDYGKAALCFQNMIAKHSGKDFPCNDREISAFYIRSGNIPHGFLSPAFLSVKELKKKFSDEDVKIIINAIFNHHIRMNIGKDILSEAVSVDLAKRFPDMNPKAGYLKKAGANFYDDDSWCRYAVILGMLNRLDYHASSASDIPVEIPAEIDGLNSGGHLTKDFCSLRPVQEYMKAHEGENIAVTASTGIGKTEGALLWAGSGKLFYTLPLRVSINAIYERIRAKYGNAVLLHSDALSYLMANDYEDDFDRAKLVFDAAKLFSYPVTVCTVDQILSFVYKARGTEKLLASLSYARLVIDEIQAYSPDIIAKIIYALLLIQKAGGKFAIMTATLPPVVRHFMLKEGLDFKEPEVPFLTDSIRNYIEYRESDDFDYDFIIEKSQGKKALVICNTVKSAQHVYGKLTEKLGDNNALHLLHSEFTRKDRRMLEKAIMEAEEPCIWVTTQLVEASLDIDFDILFTDLAPVDSLVQRMGRCYRRREYSVGEPNVYIYNLMDAKHKGKNTIYDEFILKRSAEALRKYGGILSEKDKAELVNCVYDAEALCKSNFYKSVEDGISELKNILSDIYSAEKAEKKFRDIQSVAVIPDNIYDAKIDDIDRFIDIIRNEESSLYEKKHAEERLFDMTVSVNFMKYRKIIESPKVLNYGNGKMFYRINGMDYDFDACSLRGFGLNLKTTESDDEFIF